MPEPEKIVWINGYPRVEGVNVPTDKPDLPQQVLSDEQWEAEMKARGLTGWELTQAFIRRVLNGD